VRWRGLFNPSSGESAGVPNASKSRRTGSRNDNTNTVNVTKPGRELGVSFDGIDLATNEQAAGFSLEPPDQGLCAGPDSVLELVNDTGRVYGKNGLPKGEPFYLNDFFKEDPLVGVSDPSCYYDRDTQRFYADSLIYDLTADGQLAGPNHIDLAVSSSADPAGSWNVYGFDVVADGLSANNFGDYPQIGADAEGLYITTNSYPTFEDGFSGAQLYAMSKRGIAAATDPDLTVTKVDLPVGAGGVPFTLRPTTSPGSYAHENGGTEHLLASQAAEETGNTTGLSRSIALWALTGTDSLAPHHTRSLTISSTQIRVGVYGVSPKSSQKTGPFPLGQCLSNARCAGDVFGLAAAVPSPFGPLDSSDSRMHQTVYARGLVYGALDTVVRDNGKEQAGIAWYVVRPSTTTRLTGAVVQQGTLALQGGNLIYPTFGITTGGGVALSFTAVGPKLYPSAAYVTFDAQLQPSAVHLAAAGVGPTDGFSEYGAFFPDGVPGPRWGDYGATTPDPVTGQLWVASEYIAQSCTMAAYRVDPTCGGTRTAFGNWATRVTALRP
jgi:hypothetical protein